jgi:hypothetical protein
MSNTDTILAMIRESSGLTEELVCATGIQPHQQVNLICNRLAHNGQIVRERDARGLLVNRPVASAPGPSRSTASLEPIPPPSEPLSRGMRDARFSDLDTVDPTTTLLVIACSGSKVRDSPASPGMAVGHRCWSPFLKMWPTGCERPAPTCAGVSCSTSARCSLP